MGLLWMVIKMGINGLLTYLKLHLKIRKASNKPGEYLEFFLKEYGFIDKFQIEDIAEEIHEHTLNVFPLFEISSETEKSYLEMIVKRRQQPVYMGGYE